MTDELTDEPADAPADRPDGHDVGRRVHVTDAVDASDPGAVPVPTPHGEGEDHVLLPHPDQPTWREDYPYDTRMTEREYQKAKRALQIELLKMQGWVKANQAKIAVLFEGRDAAGKGGTIKRFTEN